MARFEKQLIINVSPDKISAVFDLAIEYFEQKDFAVENSSKPSFASFSKGSYAKDLIGWTIWPFMSSKDARIRYDVAFKKMKNQVMLDVKLGKFGHIFTQNDRDHFNNELNSLKEYITNNFSVKDNEKEKHCIECGAKIKKGSKFCSECGKKQ